MAGKDTARGRTRITEVAADGLHAKWPQSPRCYREWLEAGLRTRQGHLGSTRLVPTAAPILTASSFLACASHGAGGLQMAPGKRGLR